jgi:hypothetical protein
MEHKLFKSLNFKLKGIELTRLKVETLFHEGSIVKRDLDIAYSGLIINAVTAFENYLEKLFFSIVSGKSKLHRDVKPIVKSIAKLSEKDIRSLVVGDTRYINWLPYDLTEKRSLAYLVEGNPFRKLKGQPDKDSLNKIAKVRNAVAHSSPFSEEAFQKLISENTLPPRERTPIGYLRSVYRSSPTMIQFQSLTGEIVRMSNKLISPDLWE